MRVAAVTVLYRGGEAPLAWARALEQARERAPHVHLDGIAVDTASGDGTPARLRAAAPWVHVAELPEKRGFAAGCNAGIAVAAGADLIALINPDVRVREDFLERLAALDWPGELAARGPLVLTPEGEVEQSARAFPSVSTAFFGRTSRLARLFPQSAAARRELRADPARGPAEVDWVSGATLIVPRDRFDRIGGLDEGYFMYWEDADWCRRAHDLGMKVRYDPSLVVVHHQGSSSRHRRAASAVAFHRSALRYWRRHVARSPASSVLAGAALFSRCALVLAGLALRRATGRGGDG